MARKWNVYGHVQAGKYLGVFKAATAEEAVALALNSDAASCSVCHQCANDVEDPEVTDASAEEVVE